MLTKFNSKFFIKSFSHNFFFQLGINVLIKFFFYLHFVYQFSTMYMYQLINFNSDLRQNIRY